MYSESDLLRLEEARSDRLRSLFPELEIGGEQAIIHLNLSYTLQIHCLNPAQVDALLESIEDLKVATYMIFGSDQLEICMFMEVVWEGYFRYSDLILGNQSNEEVSVMANAVLERSTTKVHQAPDNATERQLRKLDDLMGQIAEVTGQSLEQVRGDIEALNPSTYDFEGTALVSPAIADRLIDQWAGSLKTRLRSGTAVAVELNGAGSTTAVAEPETSPDEPQVTDSSDSVKFPAIGKDAPLNYRYKPTLLAILPEDTRQAQVQAIVSGTDRATKFVNALAKALNKRFKNIQIANATEGIKRAAREILEG